MKGYPYVMGIYHKCNVLDMYATAYTDDIMFITCHLSLTVFCNHSDVSMIVFGCVTCLAYTAEILKNQISHISLIVFVDLSVHT